MLGSAGRRRLILDREGVLDHFFEPHRPSLCERCFPRGLVQPGADGGQVRLLQHNLMVHYNQVHSVPWL
jgi:hypothetical protein